VGGKGYPKNYYVRNATAKERLPALHVMALARNPSLASRLQTVENATELADAAAMFAAAHQYRR
jgi:hypothetical protein